MKELKFICEEWRDINDFNGYEVSNLGNVRGKDRLRKGKHGLRLINGQPMKLVFNKKGYPEVRFRKEGTHTRLVHRLVANAFVPNHDNKLQVNHIDGNKLNNRANNLEWVTNSENQLHAYRLGLQPSRAGENNSKAKITDKNVTLLKQLYNSGKSIIEVSKIMNVSLASARQIIYGVSWKCNTTPIIKRDDRSIRSKESIEKTIKTKQSKKSFGIEIIQISKDGNVVNTFRSINHASTQTGIPRKSIEAVVNNKEFYSKNKSKIWKMTEAGGYIWKKL
jgi:hypothetical protein